MESESSLKLITVKACAQGEKVNGKAGKWSAISWFLFVVMVTQVPASVLLKYSSFFFKDGALMIPEVVHPVIYFPEGLPCCSLC